jgi:hypothetical protein
MEITTHIKPVIIGLVAVDGTGKTTLAEEFARKYDEVVHRSIKGPLYDAVSALIGGFILNTQENKSTMLSELFKITDPRRPDKETGTFRDLQVDMGSLIEKHFGDNYLMKVFLFNLGNSTKSVVLDDVRTPGQAMALKDAGGLLVYLRPRQGQVVIDHPLNVTIKDKTQHLCHASIAVDDISQAIRDLEGVLISFNSGKYEE